MNLIQFKSWPEKRRRWTLRLAAAFVVYSLVGFFLVPVVVKWQLVKRLSGTPNDDTGYAMLVWTR